MRISNVHLRQRMALFGRRRVPFHSHCHIFVESLPALKHRGHLILRFGIALPRQRLHDHGCSGIIALIIGGIKPVKVIGLGRALRHAAEQPYP